MAYRDPYSNNGHSNYGAYNSQPQYQSEFNPYVNSQQAYPTYDQGGADYDHYNRGRYTDEPAGYGSRMQEGPQRQATTRTFLTGDDERTRPGAAPVRQGTKDADQTSGFEQGEFTNSNEKAFASGRVRGDRSMWTRGGGVRCCGRFFCCTIMTAVFLVLSIFLALLLWVRPPAVSISEPQPVATGSVFQLNNDGITINMGSDISVDNPNYFALGLNQIHVDLIYPVNNTAIGSGTLNDVNFPSNQEKNITFPFSLTYSTSADPNFRVITDIAQKCSGSGGKLTIDYNVKVTIQVLMVKVSPTISNSATFDCPFDGNDLTNLFGSIISGGGTSSLSSDADSILKSLGL